MSIRESYNEQALVATKGMFLSVKENATMLKKYLPKTDVIVEIGVETTEKSGASIFRVAALRLNNSPEKEGKLGVNICVHKYQDLSSAAKIDYPSHGTLALPAPTSKEVVVSGESSSREIVVKKFEVVDEGTVKTMKEMDAERRCPDAFRVVQLLETVFKDGVPLPSQTVAVKKVHFVVMSRGAQMEKLNSIRASEAHHAGKWSSTGVEEALPESSRFVEMEGEFKQLVMVAEGKALPSCIPFGAIGMSSSLAIETKSEEEEGFLTKD